LALTGFGGGGKDAMEYALLNKYGVDFKNDDLNDSFAMAEYSRLKHNGKLPATKEIKKKKSRTGGKK
jgi:hypothetical protein